MFTFYLGPKKVVALAGYKTVKEALVNYAEEFGDRDPLLIMHEFSLGYGKEQNKYFPYLLQHPTLSCACSYILLNHFNSGITWSNGEIWKEMRRFAVTNLKDFGMGKKACEDKIIEECYHLIGLLKKFKGKCLIIINYVGNIF